MSRPRDTQRQRLYNAENVLVDIFTSKPEPHLKTVPMIEQWLAKRILDRAWFKKRWFVADVWVRPGRGARSARAMRMGNHAELTLPLWARQEQVIIHELAHCIGPRGKAAHGPEFAGTYIFLTEKVRGKEVADQLRESFRQHNVHWTSNHI